MALIVPIYLGGVSGLGDTKRNRTPCCNSLIVVCTRRGAQHKFVGFLILRNNREHRSTGPGRTLELPFRCFVSGTTRQENKAFARNQGKRRKSCLSFAVAPPFSSLGKGGAS
mgnify:CR=1 FL=1